MKFRTYGPFKMPRSNGGIDDQKRNQFWKPIESKYPSLSNAVGCYIFALKAAKGFRPWYVGKTDKQSFAHETWTDRNLRLYERVTREHKGLPMLFLIAKLTPRDRFQKPTKRKRSGAITELEKMLIASCLQRNSSLLNKRSTKYLEMQVPGFVNDTPGARTKAAKALAGLLRT
ncbi:MAG: hypothetical protein ABSA85_09820 [Terracidiphilus sp.]|jgi:hypothetical protein